MKKIAFVPARGGSKSIPLKNIKPLNGRPLIFWVLQALQSSETIDKIVVASDSQEIIDSVDSMTFSKVEIFHRSVSNAQDNSSTEDVMLEYLETGSCKPEDIFVLTQLTSPFTTSGDIDNAIDLYLNNAYDSLLTCARSKRFFWEEKGNPINYDYKKRPRRQDFKGNLIENGAFYINTVKNITSFRNRLSGNIGIYEMPEYTQLELDEAHDWVIAEQLMRSHGYSVKNIIPKDQIKLFLSDVDGVLTDAGMYYTELGDEIKRFSTYDGMGFKIIQATGVKVGIVTAEDRVLNKRRSDKLGLDYAYHGVSDKVKIVTELCNELGLDLSNVAYIGDDINDVKLLGMVGLAACPSNARNEVKCIPGIIHLEKAGGSGAVREFAELIVNA